jgi:hypothetical protein
MIAENPNLNLKRIRLWYEALRSGEFAQGTRQLAYLNPVSDGWKHCCLGVATEVAIRASWELGVRGEIPLGDPQKKEWASYRAMPVSVCEWYGLDRQNDPLLKLPNGAGYDRASFMNDIRDYSFDQIADAIARTWPEILNEEYAP